jgi:hypothetical protein
VTSDEVTELDVQKFMQSVWGGEPEPRDAIRRDLTATTETQHVNQILTDKDHYIPRNFYGQESGRLTLDGQGRVTGGIAHLHYTEYSVIPRLHPPDQNPSWSVSTEERKLFVMNNLSIEFAELAIAQAQIQYAGFKPSS